MLKDNRLFSQISRTNQGIFALVKKLQKINACLIRAICFLDFVICFF